MTKSEAAAIMALDVQVFAREHDLAVTKDLCEARVSEWRGAYGRGTVKGAAATLANPKTVLRLARRVL